MLAHFECPPTRHDVSSERAERESVRFLSLPSAFTTASSLPREGLESLDLCQPTFGAEEGFSAKVVRTMAALPHASTVSLRIPSGEELNSRRWSRYVTYASSRGFQKDSSRDEDEGKGSKRKIRATHQHQRREEREDRTGEESTEGES